MQTEPVKQLDSYELTARPMATGGHTGAACAHDRRAMAAPARGLGDADPARARGGRRGRDRARGRLGDVVADGPGLRQDRHGHHLPPFAGAGRRALADAADRRGDRIPGQGAHRHPRGLAALSLARLQVGGDRLPAPGDGGGDARRRARGAADGGGGRGGHPSARRRGADRRAAGGARRVAGGLGRHGGRAATGRSRASRSAGGSGAATSSGRWSQRARRMRWRWSLRTWRPTPGGSCGSTPASRRDRSGPISRPAGSPFRHGNRDVAGAGPGSGRTGRGSTDWPAIRSVDPATRRSCVNL